jgi:hypothetical protein
MKALRDSIAGMGKPRALRRNLLVAAMVSLAWVTGCAPDKPRSPAISPRPGSSTASATPGAATSESARYALPRAADLCAAARRSDLDVVGTKTEEDTKLASRCKVDIASRGKRSHDVPYALHVKVQVLRDAALTRILYDSAKNTDWYRGHSPFSGTAAKRAEVRQVGRARSGVQYDEAYYAFYPDHEAAGSRDSESVLTLRTGNVMVSVDLLAGDLTGSTVSSIKPVAADVGWKIFDDVADELLALLHRTR